MVNYNFVLHNESCTLHILCQLLIDMFPLVHAVLKRGCRRGNIIVDELNEYRSNYENNECVYSK